MDNFLKDLLGFNDVIDTDEIKIDENIIEINDDIIQIGNISSVNNRKVKLPKRYLIFLFSNIIYLYVKFSIFYDNYYEYDSSSKYNIFDVFSIIFIILIVLAILNHILSNKHGVLFTLNSNEKFIVIIDDDKFLKEVIKLIKHLINNKINSKNMLININNGNIIDNSVTESIEILNDSGDISNINIGNNTRQEINGKTKNERARREKYKINDSDNIELIINKLKLPLEELIEEKYLNSISESEYTNSIYKLIKKDMNEYNSNEIKEIIEFLEEILENKYFERISSNEYVEILNSINVFSDIKKYKNVNV